MATKKLEIGQQLYYVSNNRNDRAQYVTVEKIGRKWIQLSNSHRVDKDTLIADGGNYNSPGRCYLDAEIYMKEQSRVVAWSDFKRNIHSFRLHESVTLDDILQARKLLKVDLC